MFDEAHEIEDVASDYFGRQVSNYRFEELARDAEQAVRLTRQGGPTLLRRVTRAARTRARIFRRASRRARAARPSNPRRAPSFLEQNRAAYRGTDEPR